MVKEVGERPMEILSRGSRDQWDSISLISIFQPPCGNPRPLRLHPTWRDIKSKDIEQASMEWAIGERLANRISRSGQRGIRLVGKRLLELGRVEQVGHVRINRGCCRKVPKAGIFLVGSNPVISLLDLSAKVIIDCDVRDAAGRRQGDWHDEIFFDHGAHLSYSRRLISDKSIGL